MNKSNNVIRRMYTSNIRVISKTEEDTVVGNGPMSSTGYVVKGGPKNVAIAKMHFRWFRKMKRDGNWRAITMDGMKSRRQQYDNYNLYRIGMPDLPKLSFDEFEVSEETALIYRETYNKPKIKKVVWLGIKREMELAETKPTHASLGFSLGDVLGDIFAKFKADEVLPKPVFHTWESLQSNIRPQKGKYGK